jgi:hypothetical protein
MHTLCIITLFVLSCQAPTSADASLICAVGPVYTRPKFGGTLPATGPQCHNAVRYHTPAYWVSLKNSTAHVQDASCVRCKSSPQATAGLG